MALDYGGCTWQRVPTPGPTYLKAALPKKKKKKTYPKAEKLFHKYIKILNIVLKSYILMNTIKFLCNNWKKN